MESNLIQKIFPPVTENEQNLKYDAEGLWSITYPKEADIISMIIKNELGSNIKIMDATAGIGGNTISFGKNFNQVVSVEISPERFAMLITNAQVYNLTNINFINGIEASAVMPKRIKSFKD